MTAVTAKKEPKHPLVNGKPVKFRRFQMILWGAILGVVIGAGAVAGFYWLFFQQKYGTIGGHPLSLKNWWDGNAWVLAHDIGLRFIDAKNWMLYRHGVRDRLEPAGGTLAVLSFLVGTKANAEYRLHSLWFLLGSMIALILLALAGAFAETWFLYFGPLKSAPHLETTIFSLLIGVVLGKILHYAYKPSAATIQYHILQGPISRGRTPLWVNLPDAPPTLRERFYDIQGRVQKGQLKIKLDDNIRKHARWLRPAISFGLFLLFLVVVIGNVARYGGPHNILLPGMVTG